MSNLSKSNFQGGEESIQPNCSGFNKLGEECVFVVNCLQLFVSFMCAGVGKLHHVLYRKWKDGSGRT